MEQYIHRKIDAELKAWAASPSRKTLVLRGARQVGKSSAVRELGKSFKYFLEVNFDEHGEVKSLFEMQLSPSEICQRLSALFQIPVIPGETLLFLDEIQSCIPAISKLRYFYEKYPELHVVAAGSLLEFVLEEIPSIGVGRERYLFMYPFSFEEFLAASGNEMLVDAFRGASPQNPLFEPIHQKLLNQLAVFMIIGGMPAVVAAYARNRDILECQRLLSELLLSFKQDFAKYKKRIPALRINEVFESVANQASGKFIYDRAAESASHLQIKQALELLIMAGLVHPVTHTAANGIPLGAERNVKYRRMIPFDTGLYQRILGLDLKDVLLLEDMEMINKGALAEIFVGLELIKAHACYEPAELFCWARDKKEGNAQVDYVLQKGLKIIPIEVKSGKQGAMQSLREFLKLKQTPVGIRTSLENFNKYQDIEVYPLYAISNLILV